MKILALDLGKGKTIACDYQSDSAEHRSLAVRTSPAELRALIAKCRPGRVVLEARPAAGWVADLSAASGIEAQVANSTHPAWHRSNTKRKDDRPERKDDRPDALRLAQLSALNQLPQVYLDEHAGPNAIGPLDETSDVKGGDKTPGVQRPYCGAVGEREDGVVTVHLGYARDGPHCPLDGERYLPESWSGGRERCREAGIPDEMIYRPKVGDRPGAVRPGRRPRPALRDEGYGGKPGLLRAPSGRNQRNAGMASSGRPGDRQGGPRPRDEENIVRPAGVASWAVLGRP